MTPLKQLRAEMREYAEKSPTVDFPGNYESAYFYNIASPPNILALLKAMDSAERALEFYAGFPDGTYIRPDKKPVTNPWEEASAALAEIGGIE